MPIRIIIPLILASIFLGCSEKQNPYAKAADTLHEQALMQTRKSTLADKDNKALAHFVATYLNQVKNQVVLADKEETEVFLVGFYESEKSSFRLKEELEFYINDIPVGCYSPLKNNAEILKLIPSRNPWMQYYMLWVPKVNAKSIQLEINTQSHGSVTMNFQKDEL